MINISFQILPSNIYKICFLSLKTKINRDLILIFFSGKHVVTPARDGAIGKRVEEEESHSLSTELTVTFHCFRDSDRTWGI